MSNEKRFRDRNASSRESQRRPRRGFPLNRSLKQLERAAERGNASVAIKSFKFIMNTGGKIMKQRSAETLTTAHRALSVLEAHGWADVTSYTMVINLLAKAAAAGNASACDCAFDIMSTMVGRGIEPSIYTFNALMNVCAKSGGAGYGEKILEICDSVLDMMTDAAVEPDTITFTTMLDGCARAAAFRGGRGGWTRGWEKGLEILKRMRERGVRPNALTFNILISICITGAGTRRAGSWAEQAVGRGLAVLDMMKEEGVIPGADTYRQLISMCASAAKSGYAEAVDVANDLLAEMQQGQMQQGYGAQVRDGPAKPDYEAYNVMLKVMAKSESVAGAIGVLEQMKEQGLEPDLVSFNTIMHAVANEAATGRISGPQHAQNVLEMMRAADVAPDVVTYNAFLKACTVTAWGRGTGSIAEQGRWVLDCMKQDGIEADVITYTTLLDACVKAARDGEDGGLKEAMEILKEMQSRGLVPNVVTFNCLLGACAKAALDRGDGMVDNGMALLGRMKELGIAPNAVSLQQSSQRQKWRHQTKCRLLIPLTEGGWLSMQVSFNTLIAACARSAGSSRSRSAPLAGLQPAGRGRRRGGRWRVGLAIG